MSSSLSVSLPLSVCMGMGVCVCEESGELHASVRGVAPLPLVVHLVTISSFFASRLLRVKLCLAEVYRRGVIFQHIALARLLPSLSHCVPTPPQKLHSFPSQPP